MNGRRLVKRLAKWTVEWAMTCSGAGFVYQATSAYRTGLRILAYHGVKRNPTDSYTVRLDHFRYHMRYLADHHPVLRLEDAVIRVSSGEAFESGSTVVTFDDGYAEMETYVAEILEQRQVPATFFLVTDALDAAQSRGDNRFLSWDGARKLAAAGFSVGSHTVSHRSLAGLEVDEAERELIDSRRQLEENLGRAPFGLAYPYGTVRDFTPAVVAAASRAGYRCAVTAVNGLNRPNTDPFVLRRTSMTEGDGPRTFRMIMRGRLDPWNLVDRWGYRFQRTYDAETF